MKSIDIELTRDVGLSSYNDYRQLCGLKRALVFEDFLGEMSDEVSKIYVHIKNV